MTFCIGRREVITLIGGAAAWPLAASAQHPERMRRIGVLMPFSADDAESQTRMGAFLQTLALSGWTIGRNVRIDTHWATSDAAEIRKHAAELAALAPDVILAHGTSTVGPLLQATRTVPVVFPVISDPVAAGFIDSLARPGGNATGFMTWEYSMSGKWLELLKQIAPGIGSALGPSIIKALSEKTGLSEQQVTAQLSQLLPGLVDKLTPQGRLPTHGELARFVG
jgi:ABC-type uncharacterized transport system substrate-binding protein